MNGQKFVYRFVSYPDLLKGEAVVQSEGGDGNWMVLAKKGEGKGEKREGDLDEVTKLGTSAAVTKPTNRNDYIHSGLYTSFTLHSLQNGRQLFKSIKMENPAVKMADRKAAIAQLPQLPSVIKYGNTSPPKVLPSASQIGTELSLMSDHLDSAQSETCSSLLPSQTAGAFEDIQVPVAASAFGLKGRTTICPGSPSQLPDSSQELVNDSDAESGSSQTTEVQLREKASTRTKMSSMSKTLVDVFFLVILRIPRLMTPTIRCIMKGHNTTNHSISGSYSSIHTSVNGCCHAMWSQLDHIAWPNWSNLGLYVLPKRNNNRLRWYRI